MFGAQYSGQEDFGGVVVLDDVVVRTGGGGWTHRGPVAMPKRRPTGLPSLPTLPKPPYLFLTEPDADF